MVPKKVMVSGEQYWRFLVEYTRSGEINGLQSHLWNWSDRVVLCIQTSRLMWSFYTKASNSLIRRWCIRRLYQNLCLFVGAILRFSSYLPRMLCAGRERKFRHVSTAQGCWNQIIYLEGKHKGNRLMFSFLIVAIDTLNIDSPRVGLDNLQTFILPRLKKHVPYL